MFLFKLLCGKPEHTNVWILQVCLESVLLWVLLGGFFFFNMTEVPPLFRGDYLYTIALRIHHPSMQPFHCHLLNSWASVLCYQHSAPLIGFAIDTGLMLLQRRGRQIFREHQQENNLLLSLFQEAGPKRKSLPVTECGCPIQPRARRCSVGLCHVPSASATHFSALSLLLVLCNSKSCSGKHMDGITTENTDRNHIQPTVYSSSDRPATKCLKKGSSLEWLKKWTKRSQWSWVQRTWTGAVFWNLIN